MASLDKRAVLDPVGTIATLDLDIISRFYGREFLPYPFYRAKNVSFKYQREYDDYKNSVIDRYNHGDMRTYKKWFETYLNSDVRVEYITSATVVKRISAHRTDRDGFLAVQSTGLESEAEVVEIFSISPYDIATAITQSSVLTAPGKLLKVALPDDGPKLESVQRDEFAVFDSVAIRDIPIVRGTMAAFGNIQSSWRPANYWAEGSDSPQLRWVTLKGDGDYIATPDFSYWIPMSRKMLTRRIDELISSDIKALRAARAD